MHCTLLWCIAGISGRKYTLILHMIHLPADNLHEMSFLIWFLKNSKSVVCLIRSALLSPKKCVITANTIFLHSPRRELYWIHDTFICCGIKLCTKLHNTEPDICDLWHAKSIYFRSTDTLCKQWPFPLHKVGVAFLIYESNQDRPCVFLISCWQPLCSRSWIGLSLVVFQRQYDCCRSPGAGVVK